MPPSAPHHHADLEAPGVVEALARRVQDGDRAALAELVRALEGRVFNVCYRMVSQRDDAAELAQDTLLKVVEKIDGFRGDAKLTTWVTRIAMNLCISHLRKRKLRQTVSLNGQHPSAPGSGSEDRGVGFRGGDSLAGAEPEPSSCVELDEGLDALQRAIAGLDDDQRAVLVLRDLEQLDYHQIARLLELPVGTVKSRLFRARLALRDKLNPAPTET
ncbi:MAG: sigma-70 family RNA polymerase sigma factor [Planctomycetota bacterium]